MPRKKKEIDKDKDVKKNKKNLMNTMVKENKEDQHIILQLPLTQQNIDSIINDTGQTTVAPIPYEKYDCFNSDNKCINENGDNNYFKTDEKKIEDNKKDNQYSNNEPCNGKCCYWCVHPIVYKIYGMPVYYNNILNSFDYYGSFCSLQCANAYNFSINSGSDKVWEINSLIQMVGKIYNMDLPIRPAPCRYLLNIFSGGKLNIDEYRALHKDCDTSHVLNLPPMINISSSYEIINTSYIKNISENTNNSVITKQLNIESKNEDKPHKIAQQTGINLLLQSK